MEDTVSYSAGDPYDLQQIDGATGQSLVDAEFNYILSFKPAEDVSE